MTVVRLRGDIDLDLGDALDAAVVDALTRYQPIRIDASQIVFIDSFGLSLIARLVAGEQQLQRRVQLVGATRWVLELLEISGLLSELDLQ